MKKLIFCALLAAPLAMGGYCLGAEKGEITGKTAPCKEIHEGYGPADEMRDDGRFAIIGKVLGLTDVQKEKIDGILRAEHEANMALMKAMKENGKLLRETGNAAAFDDTRLRSLAEKQGQLMARMIISPAVVRHKIRAVMTPEQRNLDDRIQPLLEQEPEHRPHFFGGELPPFMAMDMVPGPRFHGGGFPFFGGEIPKECPPCSEDD